MARRDNVGAGEIPLVQITWSPSRGFEIAVISELREGDHIFNLSTSFIFNRIADIADVAIQVSADAEQNR